MKLPVAALAAVLLSAVSAHAQTDIAAIRAESEMLGYDNTVKPFAAM